MKSGFIEIITPEGVKLHYETAGIGIRALAITIDTIIIMAVIFVLAWGLSLSDDGVLSQTGQNIYMALFIVVIIFINTVYFIFFELLFKGQTPGKKLTKIRVVKTSASPAAPGAIIMRNLLRIIDQLPVFYLVGIIAAFINPQERRIGDLVAGTIVIKEFKPKPMKVPVPVMGSRPPDMVLTPQEIMTLQSFFQREMELSPDRRKQLQKEYLDYFRRKYDLYPQEGENAVRFLKGLMSESSKEPEPDQR